MRIATLALVTACSMEPAPPPVANVAPVARVSPHALEFSLERRACYGWCPIYTVRIYRDGAVEYHGEAFVKVRGDAKARVTDAQLAALEHKFIDARYLTLADNYTHEDLTDAPTAISSFAQDGQFKQVSHYYGDEHAPETVSKLEDAIDHAVAIERWIGSPEEREQHAQEWR
jgi:hypothetical protein